MERKTLFFKSICFFLIVSMLFSLGIMLAFAQDGDNSEEEEAGESVIFYDAETLNANKKWGHQTNTSMVVDEKTGVSAMRFSPTGDLQDPYMVFAINEELSAEEYPFVSFIVKKRSQQINLKLYFKTSAHEQMNEQMMKRAKYNPNDKWQIITVELSDLPSWSGKIEELRIDYFDGAMLSESDYCDLAGIVIGKTENEVLNVATGFFAEKLGAVARFADFNEIDLGYFASATYNTTLVNKGPNIVYESTGLAADPQAMWNFEGHLEYKGLEPLSAEDFGYMVIKYRADTKNGMKQSFEAFYQVGDRIYAKAYHSATAECETTGEWLSMTLAFANGPEWAGTVHSFRIDWTTGSTISQGVTGYMEISDFVLFADAKTAARFANIIDNIIVYRLEVEEEETEETTGADLEDGTIDIGIFESTEETEETTEETLPEFIETTEETTEVITEEPTEEITEEMTDEITEEDTEEITEEATEEKTEPKPLLPGADTGIVLPGEVEVDSGSQTPFVVACVILALMSVASIVTVIVIRAKAKKEQNVI